MATAKAPKPHFKNPVDGKELYAVTVWQEMTYLVRCQGTPESALEAILDPTNRIALVGDGQINKQVNRMEVVDLEMLHASKAKE